MFDEQRLGNDWPRKHDNGDNQMKETDEGIAHPGMVAKPEKHPIFAQCSNSPWTRCFVGVVAFGRSPKDC
jgi:hypothetical protein